MVGLLTASVGMAATDEQEEAAVVQSGRPLLDRVKRTATTPPTARLDVVRVADGSVSVAVIAAVAAVAASA